MAIMVLFCTMTTQVSFSEMTLNDNVNIEGDVFLEGVDCGINFSDGSRQTTGAIPPWSQKISEDRFVLVLDDEAVLDRETGLVWQRNTGDTGYNWEAAQNVCHHLEIGGRMGWRLPTIDELATLIDRTQSPLTLPEGHPFTNVKVFYWSSTAYVGDPGGGLRVELDQGFVHGCPSAIKNPIRAVRSGR